MGLVAWYPLNGNLNDYSGNSFAAATAVGGATINSSGKIGSCYDFNGTDAYLTLPNLGVGQRPFSLCAWIKTSGFGASTSFTAGIVALSFSAILCHDSSGYLSLRTNDAQNKYTGRSIADNSWHHCVATHDGNVTGKLYIDGDLVKTFTTAQYGNTYSNSQIGNDPNNFTYKFFGRINDARIYDHALSEKEVKEISRAKILHYAFNDFQEPTTNLINSTFVGWNVWAGATVTLTQNRTVEEWGTTRATLIEVASGGTAALKYFANIGAGVSGASYSVQVRVKNTGATTVVVGTQYGFTQSVAPGTSAYITNTVTSNGVTNVQLRFESLNASDGLSFLAFQPQIEKKPMPTPFVNGTRSGIVSDSSGYRIDSPLVEDNSPSWGSTYSKVGTGGYRFISNLSPYIVVPNSQCKVTDQITVSAWAHRSNWSDTSSERIISCTESGGWQLGFNDTADYISFQSYINGSYSPATYGLSLMSSGWHLITGTFDGRYAKLYVDGVLRSTVDRGATYPITYNATNGIFIGAEPGAGNTVPNLAYWNGYIDDVRIYATALSGTDVLELYQTKGSLDSYGNFFTNELVQISNFSEYYNANNLVLNGSAELGNNTNFTTMGYTTSDGYDDLKSFVRSGSHGMLSGQYIPVNYLDTYRLSGWFKSAGITFSKLYYGLVCYDKNKAEIEHKMVMHYTNTRTTLAATLFPGATIAYLTSGTNWTAGTSGVYHFTKQIACWPSDTREYPPYTYTRATGQYLTLNGNEIWLNGTWAGATIPMGSEVANNYDGGTYIYIAAGNVNVPFSWTNYAATVTGWGVNDSTKFRYGTEFIRILGLLNLTQGVSYTLFVDRMQFLNTTSYQATPGSTQGVQESGTFKTIDVSEVAVTEALVSYLPFDSGATNIISNSASTITGATLVSGIRTHAYGFTTGSRIDAPGAVNGLFSGQKFSLGAWVYRTGSSRRILIDSNGAIELNIETATNTASFTLQHSTGYSSAISTSIISADTWNHVFGTYDGVFAKIYINGALEATTRINNFINPGATMYIGNWADSAQSFLGKIEEVRVYNKDLTAQDVQLLYDMTKPSANAMKITDDTVYLLGEIKEVV